jgi:hypothetical protein
MPARFFVTKSFPLKQSKLFVLAGKIVEGEVRAGMRLLLCFNPPFNTILPIHSVEFVDSIEKREAEIGLTVKYDNDEELEMLLALNIESKEIEIQEETNVKENT